MPTNRRLALTWAALATLLLPACAAPLTPLGPQPTLWNALAIPQAGNRFWDCAINRRGRHPGLERKPGLLRIADPELAKIDNAAIQKAQKIKAEEDLAPQKIKAIKYLATLGCEKCYGGIEDAMLESLKDCTEKVRYETVKALGKTIKRRCTECDQDCCTEKITEQLAKMAYEREADRPDCWYERSERVRKAAVALLKKCCSSDVPPDAATDPAPDPEPRGEPKADPEPKPLVRPAANSQQAEQSSEGAASDNRGRKPIDDAKLHPRGHDILRSMRRSATLHALGDKWYERFSEPPTGPETLLE